MFGKCFKVSIELCFGTRPAAGPPTPSCDPLNVPTTIPPIIPAIIPEKSGTPEAKTMPRQRGRATRKTIILAKKSCQKVLARFFII